MQEWATLWWVAHDEAGLLSREKVRANYDGTLWPRIAAEVSN